MLKGDVTFRYDMLHFEPMQMFPFAPVNVWESVLSLLDSP